MIRRPSVAFLVLSILTTLPMRLAAQQPTRGVLIVQSMPGEAPMQKPSSANQQAGPSLSETVNFIRNTLLSYGTVERTSRFGIQIAVTSFSNTLQSVDDSCRLTFVGENRSRGSIPTGFEERWTSTVTLGDLDPSSIKVAQHEASPSLSGEGFELMASTSNMAKTISSTSMPPNSTGGYGAFPPSSQTDVLHLQMSDKDMAERVAQALTHAIELCGGKKSAF